MNRESPFEQWRLKALKGMAASSDIIELLALSFEAGRNSMPQECNSISFKDTEEGLWIHMECDGSHLIINLSEIAAAEPFVIKYRGKK